MVSDAKEKLSRELEPAVRVTCPVKSICKPFGCDRLTAGREEQEIQKSFTVKVNNGPLVW